MCITTKDVFAWGSNEYGQLGHGDAAPDVCSRPFPIKVLHDVMVTQVREEEGDDRGAAAAAGVECAKAAGVWLLGIWVRSDQLWGCDC